MKSHTGTPQMFYTDRFFSYKKSIKFLLGKCQGTIFVLEYNFGAGQDGGFQLSIFKN
jgi:hypothetical protein